MKGSPEARDRAGQKSESADHSLPSPTGGHRGWEVRTSAGPAKGFHDLDPQADTGHEIWIHRIDRPAVVFGSTQLPGRLDEPTVNADRGATDAPIEYCRRRSGGGLVVVRPDDVWIDAVVPRHSALHRDDVGLAFHWFGQVWLEALGPLITDSGLDDRDLRLAEPVSGRRASDRPFFCFADTGYGEVLHGDRKVVGISQRRTRNWTRLQSLLVATWNPTEIDELVDTALTLAGSPPLLRADLGRPPHDASGVQAGFKLSNPPLELGAKMIVRAVLRCLPAIDDGDRPDQSLRTPR